MPQPALSDRSYGRMFLTYQIALVSVGISSFAIAIFPDGTLALIAMVVGCGLITSAFIGLPKAIIEYMRKGYGIRPGLETANAVGLPLCLAVFFGWSTINDVRLLAHLAYSVTPRWYDIAEPWIHGVTVPINLAVLVANVISLKRERREPA